MVPVTAEIVADTLTPVAAAAAFRDREGSYLLESVVGAEKWARYSFVGCGPDAVVRGGDDVFEVLTPDEAGGLSVRERLTGVDPYQCLREVLDTYRPPEGLDWLPRFWGGAVGCVSYDIVHRFEPKVPHPTGGEAMPEFTFALGGPLLIFDNVYQTLKAVVPVKLAQGDDVGQAYEGAVARIEEVLQTLHDARLPGALPLPDGTRRTPLASSNFTQATFEKAVEVAKEHIRAGDIFQVVLSQKFTEEAGDLDMFNLYRAMRVVNPSPYMYWLRLPEMEISGASPETLVRLEDGMVEVRPIAGTRPRGKTEAEDHALERELLSDPKEVAEHVMLVDLGRNDIGRIAEPGSVRIDDRMVIERYSHVMHIVSSVQGRLMPGKDALDVLAATFPAGTLSGAPKVRAMQIIAELEGVRRGVYGGAVGYISFGGNLDVAIAIRTAVKRGDQLEIQAGAGIVEASDPTSEYQETLNKAGAVLVGVDTARRASRS